MAALKTLFGAHTALFCVSATTEGQEQFEQGDSFEVKFAVLGSDGRCVLTLQTSSKGWIEDRHCKRWISAAIFQCRVMACDNSIDPDDSIALPLLAEQWRSNASSRSEANVLLLNSSTL